MLSAPLLAAVLLAAAPPDLAAPLLPAEPRADGTLGRDLRARLSAASQRESALWHAEEQRWADRLAFLLSRDATAAIETIAGDKDPHTSPRVIELVRYLGSENCWRAYRRLTEGS